MNDTLSSPPPPPPSSGPPPSEPPPEGPRAGMNTAALGDYRTLRRSAWDRKVAGVAGGLARHLDVDPLLVRVLFVVLAFFGGSGILLYAVLWLLVPDERDGHTVVPSDESTRNVLVIVALVVATLIALTTGVGGDSGGVWFICVVAVGALAFHLIRQNRREHASQSAPAAPTWTAEASGATYSSTTTAPGMGATGSTWTGSGWSADRPYGTPPGGGSWTPPPAYPPARRRRRGPLLFMPTLALVALGAGVLGLLDSQGTSVPDAAYAALALATVGVMLVVGSFFGRAGGLILVGLVALGALGATAVAEPSYSGSRDVMVRPTSSSDLQSSYSVPAGRVEIDLTDVSEPSALAGRTIQVDVNAGEIVVIVPPEVAIDLEADIEYGGAIDTPDGQTTDGWGTSVERTYDAENGSGGAPLELDLEAGFGHIDVRRG